MRAMLTSSWQTFTRLAAFLWECCPGFWQAQSSCLIVPCLAVFLYAWCGGEIIVPVRYERPEGGQDLCFFHWDDDTFRFIKTEHSPWGFKLTETFLERRGLQLSRGSMFQLDDNLLNLRQVYYYTNGVVSSIGQLDCSSGEPRMRWEYWDDAGQPTMMMTIDRDRVFQGPAKFFGDDGTLHRSGENRNGECHGDWTTVFPPNGIIFEERYDEGRLLSTVYRTQEGDVIAEGTFRDDQCWEGTFLIGDIEGIDVAGEDTPLSRPFHPTHIETWQQGEMTSSVPFEQ